MKPLIVWLILCVVWGTTWIFIKVGLDDLPPISFAALRFFVACVLLLPVILRQKIEMPKTRRDWLMIVVTGVMQFFLNYGLLFWGEQRISSGLSAVLQATIPAFGLLVARFYIPTEKITFLKVASILTGIVGVAIIFNGQLEFGGAAALWGSVAVVIGAFCAAYASVLTKAYGNNMHPANMVFWQMLCGMLPLALVGFWQEGSPLSFHWTTSAVVCVLYLAVMGSIAAFWLYYWLLRHMDVTRAMMISLVTPLMAVIIGAIWRGEQLQIQALFGALFILTSVALVVLRPLLDRRKKEPVETEQHG
jgi:drug/metabolite transporter (DMT)-like permease